MLKSKLIPGVALLLFGASANAGLIASMQAHFLQSAVKQTVKNPVVEIAEISVDPGTESGIEAIIDSIESVAVDTLSPSEVLASIDPDMHKVISDEDISLAGSTPVGASVSLSPETSQPVPAPPVFWLFVTGLIGLAGFSKQRKAA